MIDYVHQEALCVLPPKRMWYDIIGYVRRYYDVINYVCVIRNVNAYSVLITSGCDLAPGIIIRHDDIVLFN